MTPARQRVSSGGPWEDRVGYSRAVRVGDQIWVAGTTGTASDGAVPPDVGSQTGLALDTIEAALTEAGASLAEVVVARIYVTDIEQWEAVAEVLRDRTGQRAPGDDDGAGGAHDAAHLIEVEVEAVVGAAD